MLRATRNTVRSIGICAGAAIAALLPLQLPAQDAQPKSPHLQAIEQNWPMLESYCVECHNFTDWAGGVAFDTMQPEAAVDEAEIWEEAIRKLRGRMMPPPGKKRPDSAQVDSFVAAMETYLDDASVRQPNPGTVPLHRLNRAEYANAI
jgi:hypothetical protein